MAQPQTHQLQRDRLGADLLSVQPQCCNLSGELAADLGLVGGGWPRPPTTPWALTVTAAIGVALLLPAAVRQHRR